MDNHPIPQDVTGFQFKLIGNMTVKQFAYLATGIVFAWILYQLPVNLLIKFPFCALSAIFGAGLAFFPISGRPMDLMIGNYIKALFRPTQFIYEKVGGRIYFPNKTLFATAKSAGQYKNVFSPLQKDKLKAYLESLDAKPKNKADERENNFLMSVSSLAISNTPDQPAVAPNLIIQQAHLQPNPSGNSDSPKALNIMPSIKTAASQPVATPQPTLQAKPLAKQESLQETVVSGQIKTAKPKRKGINNAIGMRAVLDSPNLITGITKDSRGNALSSILIEIKDKDGNPVRAFKTNEFGRFASATPLINGTYIVEFEDPKAQNKFEEMTIDIIGQIIPPIEAISIDTREEIRRSLFASNVQKN